MQFDDDKNRSLYLVNCFVSCSDYPDIEAHINFIYLFIYLFCFVYAPKSPAWNVYIHLAASCETHRESH